MRNFIIVLYCVLHMQKQSLFLFFALALVFYCGQAEASWFSHSRANQNIHPPGTQTAAAKHHLDARPRHQANRYQASHAGVMQKPSKNSVRMPPHTKG